MSKSPLELFIRRTSVKTSVAENIVDVIIRDQWKRANKAAHIHDEIDIPEIGMFFRSNRKRRLRLTKLTDIKNSIEYQLKEGNLDIDKQENYKKKLASLEGEIGVLLRAAKQKEGNNEN